MNLPHTHIWTYRPEGKDVVRTCRCGAMQITRLKPRTLKSIGFPFTSQRLYFGFGLSLSLKKWEDYSYECEEDCSDEDCSDEEDSHPNRDCNESHDVCAMREGDEVIICSGDCDNCDGELQ